MSLDYFESGMLGANRILRITRWVVMKSHSYLRALAQNIFLISDAACPLLVGVRCLMTDIDFRLKKMIIESVGFECSAKTSKMDKR